MTRVVDEVLFENQTMIDRDYNVKGAKQLNSREASKNGYLIKTKKKKMLSRNPQGYESAFSPFADEFSPPVNVPPKEVPQ